MSEASARKPDQSETAFYQSSLSIRPAFTYKFLLTFTSLLSSTYNSSTKLNTTFNTYSSFKSSKYKIPTMTVPTTCCGRSGQACVCAQQAKCSCGKQSALKCNCGKASTENSVTGARCSCRKSSPPPPTKGTLPARSSLRGISPAANSLRRLLVVRSEVLVNGY